MANRPFYLANCPDYLVRCFLAKTEGYTLGFLMKRYTQITLESL